MSNVSSIHDVKPFKAGDKALSGQRLAKVGYKSATKNPARFKSVAVSVPYISNWTEDRAAALRPYFVQVLETAQDGILKSLYESSDGTLTQIQDQEISVDACLAFLKTESEGNRLTAELIGQWFDTELADALTVVMAQKLSFIPADAPEDSTVELTEAQSLIVEKHLRIHKELFSSLAGGATILAEKQIKGLKNALCYADERSTVTARLMKRLESMEKKTVEEFFGI